MSNHANKCRQKQEVRGPRKGARGHQEGDPEAPASTSTTSRRSTPPSRRRSRSTRTRETTPAATQHFRRDAPTEADPVNAGRRRTKHLPGVSATRPEDHPTRPTTTGAAVHNSGRSTSGLTRTTARGFRAWQLSEKHRLALERQAKEHHRDHGPTPPDRDKSLKP